MKKVGTFILCILPMILFFGTCIPLYGVTMASEMGMMSDEALSGLALFLLIGAILAVIAVYGVMIWQFVGVIKNKNVTNFQKVVWCLFLYFLNIFVFPVYWFVFLRKEQ